MRATPIDRQTTLREKVFLAGVGLHSGAPATIELVPAAAGTGLLFVQRGPHGVVEIPASYAHVTGTQLATTLTRHDELGQVATIATVEHLLSACAGLGVDNLRIHVEGGEVPVLDGSAAPFVDAMTAVGLETLEAPSRTLVVRREVRVSDGVRSARFVPGPGFVIECTIDFDHPVISDGPFVFEWSPESYRREVAAARTFGFVRDIETLRAAGLARGGSLANAVVVDEFSVLNREGLRFPDEFVRHKVLDALGDLALLGSRIQGKVQLHCPGHALNVRLLEALMSDSKNFAIKVPPGLAIPQATRPRRRQRPVLAPAKSPA